MSGAGASGLITQNPEFSLDLSGWWHVLYRFIKISSGLVVCEAEFDSKMPGPGMKWDRGDIQGTTPPHTHTPPNLPSKKHNQLQEGSNLVCGPDSVHGCVSLRLHHVLFFKYNLSAIIFKLRAIT